jgi:hypothetical protein
MSIAELDTPAKTRKEKAAALAAEQEQLAKDIWADENAEYLEVLLQVREHRKQDTELRKKMQAEEDRACLKLAKFLELDGEVVMKESGTYLMWEPFRKIHSFAWRNHGIATPLYRELATRQNIINGEVRKDQSKCGALADKIRKKGEPLYTLEDLGL